MTIPNDNTRQLHKFYLWQHGFNMNIVYNMKKNTWHWIYWYICSGFCQENYLPTAGQLQANTFRPKIKSKCQSFCSACILSCWLWLWTLPQPKLFQILHMNKTYIMIMWPYPGTTDNIYWVTMFRHSMNHVTPIIFCRWFLLPTASLKNTYLAELIWIFTQVMSHFQIVKGHKEQTALCSDVMLSIGCHVKFDPYASNFPG